MQKKIFSMVHHLAYRKDKIICTAFNELYIYYRKWVFRIINIHTDGEFEPLQEIITENMPVGTTMNLTSANEHVTEIERRIRVVKERAICVRHSLPFTESQYPSFCWEVI